MSNKDCQLEEINPGVKNPTMSPGHNNAIYCLVCAPGTPYVLMNFSVRLYRIWDQEQGKYKYYMKFIPVPGSYHAAPPNEIEACETPFSSDNLYWQVELQDKGVVCTDGAIAWKASNTDAIILTQHVDPSKPEQ